MKFKLKSALIAATLALMTATVAKADANPANDSGSFTVRITPNVDLGVTVDTTGANWAGASTNLDVTSDLATDTLLEAPVKVAMAGNFSNQELTLTGVALDTWVLDTDEIDVVDQMRLYGTFGLDPFFAGTPDAVDFTAADLITTAAKRAGQPQADEDALTDVNHVYELPGAHAESEEVDHMTVSTTRSLWLRTRTPNTTTTSGQARFTVIVTAVSGPGL